jgi:hypothetical protein
MEETMVKKSNDFNDLMAIQKEMLEENKLLRMQTFCLIMLTIILIMEPVTSLMGL